MLQPLTRLNVGSGAKVYEGWINIDLDPAFADIVADVRSIPLPDEYADEIMAIHILEHIERWEAPMALREWCRLLKPGGLLILELPDFIKCCHNVTAGFTRFSEGESRWAIYGDPTMRNPLMIHRWGWTVDELIKELKAVGFKKVKVREPQFHGHKVFRDMRLESRKR